MVNEEIVTDPIIIKRPFHTKLLKIKQVDIRGV